MGRNQESGRNSQIILNLDAINKPRASDKNRQYIDFEKPIKDLLEEIDDLKQKAEKSKVDYSEFISKLEESVIEK